MMSQVALHVSRISDSSMLMQPSGHTSFLTNPVLQGPDDSFPSFVSNRPVSVSVFGRKVTEVAEVLVKDRDETRFPLPVFYPKKVERHRRPQPAKPAHKPIQSTSRKPRSIPPKPQAKVPVSAPPPSFKRLNPKKATEPVPVKRPEVPKLPPHPRPVSTVSSKSADKISATEMLRYLEDVPKMLEPDTGEIQPLVDEIIKESLRKQREAKEQRQRAESLALEERQRRKEELAYNNHRIRQINKTRFKAKKDDSKLPWGADQRRILGIAEQQFQKEANVLREKRRMERAKSAGRSRLGLEILEILNPQRNSPPKRSTSAEESSNSRYLSHYDSEEIQLYMRRQREMIREEQETEVLRAQAEEGKRISQLEDLEYLQKNRLASYKKTKKRKETKRKSKKKRQKVVKIPSHSESAMAEDSEVSHIMYQNHESSEVLLEDGGRSCKMFGNIAAVSEEFGNATKLVSSIVDRHGMAERSELPKALNTAPVKDALNSSKPSNDFSADMREDLSDSQSYGYPDHLDLNPPHDEFFHEETEEEEGHEELIRRKEEVRRRLADLRSKMENIKDAGYEEPSGRASDRPAAVHSSPPVVQHKELRSIVERDAAIKIQAHVRRFLVERRVMRMLDEMEEELPALLNQYQSGSKQSPSQPKARPAPIYVPQYEDDPKVSSLPSGNHLTQEEFELRLREEQLNFARIKEQEIERLREENKKLQEEQKKQVTVKPEDGYANLLNSVKEQEMQQFQELMQTKCGSRVDLVEEMSMAFENMLEARYRHLVLLFSQNREGMQAALGSAPSEMDISSTFAHTNLQKATEEAKTPELPQDSGLDLFLNKVLGTQETKEIERMAQEKIAEIAKKAEEQAGNEDQSFDPYSARPENPFPDEDSESGSSLHSYKDDFPSPTTNEIRPEEESKSPMKKKRITDAFTKPLQLQLVTGENQESSSRSLSRSGKFRYFKDDFEGKELQHVPSPDPASANPPSPIKEPERPQTTEGSAKDIEEPSKPQGLFQVSRHLLQDIDSSGSFQDDVEDMSSVEERLGVRWEERDKNAVFEALYRPFFERVVAESMRISGVKVAQVVTPPVRIPAPVQEEVKLPPQPPPTSPSIPASSESPLKSPEIPEIPEIRLFDAPEKPEIEQEEVDKHVLADEIYKELWKKLLQESVPKPISDKSMPELPPLNFKQLEDREERKFPSKSKAEIPEKVNSKHISAYLGKIFHQATTSDIIQSLSTAISFDAVDILGQLQDIEQGPLITYDLQSKSIIPTEVYLSLDEPGEGGSSRRDMTPSTKDIIRDSKRFHNKLVFDAVNEALQKYRPYGLKGAPLPWSTNVRALAPPLPQLHKIQEKVISEVAEWSTFEVGKIPEGEIILSSGQVDEEQLQLIREERLSKMLTQEILENDQVWVDYEAEEAQVKIDIADMILEQIMTEIEDFLHGLELI